MAVNQLVKSVKICSIRVFCVLFEASTLMPLILKISTD